MENSRKKTTKPKTIRMKYPAQYSPPHLTTADPDSPLTPKPSKRKPRITSYSAQTWKDKEKRTAKQTGKQNPARRASSRQISNNKKNPNRPRPPQRITPHSSAPNRPNVCRPPIRRLDPSAVHLKYGVFPKKNSSLIGNESSGAVVTSKPGFNKKVNRTNFVTTERNPILVGRNSFQMGRKYMTTKEKEESIESEDPPSDAPLTYRPQLQRLATSDVKHLDIKPGRYRIASPRLPKIAVL